MRRRRALTGRAGLTLIETTVSVAVTGGLLVAALAMLGDVSTGRVVVSDRTRGAMLAHDLLAEVQAAKYESSDFGPGSFGRAADEPAGGPQSGPNDRPPNRQRASEGATRAGCPFGDHAARRTLCSPVAGGVPERLSGRVKSWVAARWPFLIGVKKTGYYPVPIFS